VPQYTMNSDYAAYVAMDVHSRSITMHAVSLETGEPRTRRLTGCPGAAEVVEWAKSWLPDPILFVYESGPCGFQLQRDIEALGCACRIAAVTSIPRSPEDKYLKDDRRDARRLLSEITKMDGKVKFVYVPSPRMESLRDLTRARHDAVKAAKRSKQQAAGLLTRYGHVWDEKTPTGRRCETWTEKHKSWMKSAEFDQALTRRTLDLYVQNATEDIERVKNLTRLCLAEAEKPDVKPYVDALTRLKCVDVMTALAFLASMGDFERFSNGRSVSSYFGLTPRRSDSGEKTGRNGKITKAGDTLCRMLLTEGVGGIGAAKSNVKKLRKGQVVSPQVEAEARKCNARNRARYEHLTASGKHANVAKIAVASELVRDMWIIGRMVQREQAEQEAR